MHPSGHRARKICTRLPFSGQIGRPSIKVCGRKEIFSGPGPRTFPFQSTTPPGGLVMIWIVHFSGAGSARRTSIFGIGAVQPPRARSAISKIDLIAVTKLLLFARECGQAPRGNFHTQCLSFRLSSGWRGFRIEFSYPRSRQRRLPEILWPRTASPTRFPQSVRCRSLLGIWTAQDWSMKTQPFSVLLPAIETRLAHGNAHRRPRRIRQFGRELTKKKAR
jgi:hypothetical protein